MSAFQSKYDPILEQLEGTDSIPLEYAYRYCRSLARGHYENFIVGTILVPRRLMQHLYNIYAFCRFSDDLADEPGDPSLSIQLLDGWKEQLRLCYEGKPTHPILVALQSTVQQFEIPRKPFEDLISAFEQDCKVDRYETYSDVLDYCTRSANPVGRVFLWLFGYKDAERQELSDRICTGLQLANFWQDVASDYKRGRIYLPQEDMVRFGCNESDIAEHRTTQNFIELMKFEVDRAEELFQSAAELPKMLNRRLAVDVELFRVAGLAVLSAVRKIDYNVLNHRPVISKAAKFEMFFKCILGFH